MADLTPITRKEKYLAKAGGQEVTLPPYPITREEKYLKKIADNSGGTEVDSEMSTTSENPVQNKVITAAVNANTADISNIQQTIGNINTVLEEVL